MCQRVLIVDDHPTFRASARLVLEADGYDVVGEAADGESAIEQNVLLGPDVILLDVHLPGMNGFEVATRITERPAAPAVILTSSRDAAELGPLVMTCGAVGFVPKADLSGERLRALLKT